MPRLDSLCALLERTRRLASAATLYANMRGELRLTMTTPLVSVETRALNLEVPIMAGRRAENVDAEASVVVDVGQLANALAVGACQPENVVLVLVPEQVVCVHANLPNNDGTVNVYVPVRAGD